MFYLSCFEPNCFDQNCIPVMGDDNSDQVKFSLVHDH